MSVEENKTSIAVVCQKIADIKDDIKGFVTIERFTPVEKIVYGFVGLVLVAFAGALIALNNKS